MRGLEMTEGGKTETRQSAQATAVIFIAAIGVCLMSSQSARADAPSAFGSGFDVQDFYRPFTLDEITPKNQQKWPYYKYVSAHWDKYALHGTKKVNRSANPAKLSIADEGQRFDLNSKFKSDQTFIDSLLGTQAKGFVVVKDNKILAEFYDNGFNVGDTNLLSPDALLRRVAPVLALDGHRDVLQLLDHRVSCVLLDGHLSNRRVIPKGHAD